MEEKVARRFKKWKNKLQQHLKYERRGCKNIWNVEEKVARTTLNTFFLPHLKMFKGEGFFCERRGCKNIWNVEEKVARIFKIWKKRLQEYLKCGEKGCKNI